MVRRQLERWRRLPARTWNRWLALLVVLAAGGVYYALNRQAFQDLHIERWHLLPLLVGIQLARLAVNGLVLKTFVGVFGIRLRPGEWLGLAAMMALGSYVATGAGGVALQAGVLKHRFGLPYARFVALTGAGYLVGVSLASALGVTTYAFYYRSAGLGALQILVLLVVVGAAVAVAVASSPSMRIGSGRVGRWLGQVQTGWRMLRLRAGVLAQVTLLMAVNLALYALALCIVFAAFGVPTGAPPTLLMAAAGSLSVLIPVTPGNLGILESITAATSHFVGLGFHVGLAAQSLARAAAMVNVFVLGPLFSYWLLKK